MSDKMKTSYSMWAAFRNCRMLAYWRYIRNLDPKTKAVALYFGSLIHLALELWHQERELERVIELIDREAVGEPELANRAKAMMRGYANHYPTEDFKVIALEREYNVPIVNPATGAKSLSFYLTAKVDGLVEAEDGYWLLEHKTASVIDQTYLDKLWFDFQSLLYCRVVADVEKIDVRGVVYNVLVKDKLKQGQGESDEEYEERKAALIAKSKSGKSSAKQKVAESDEDFAARLDAKYDDPSMYHREHLVFSPARFAELQAELWELTQAWLDARKRDVWYSNNGHCFAYHRSCPYMPLCKSGGNENLIALNYQPHRTEEKPEEPKPF